ncbi:hypothetical protein EYF80_013136 [Liparis tanakae]|uniref:Uncharacterized protein n=1 Tax=Liparis tanakae TaxID=230148 RepID=A0A4Z2IGW1_9TELE|nr:hypothetical protein EYF80_013136 [Liparis tanakae]
MADLAATSECRLPQGQNHLRRVPPHTASQIPATSDGPGLGRFLIPSLLKRLEVALVRAWGRGLASWWDKVGEVGGAE